VTPSCLYRLCIQALLPPRQLTLSLPSLPSIFSPELSFRAATDCSSSRTALVKNEARKRRLVRVAFEELMSSYPSCLQDGWFLLAFFICHPSDLRINAINQHYWLQYHTFSKLQSPLSSTETHLIKPSDTSVDYALRHKLRPFCKWLNLTHLDTFIHGPFEFAAIHGRKTLDRISQVGWDVLKSHLDMFHNPIPPFNVPSYSIHVDHCAHIHFHDAAISRQLILAASLDPTSPGMPTHQ
jgi:hypothetical protein